MIGYCIFIALLVAGDQLIKLWAQGTLKPLGSIDLLSGVLSLTYHENFGAAWGILQGQRWLLLSVTGVVIAGLLAALVMGKLRGRLLNLSVALIVAGGLGNLLDRTFHAGGFVVDYIYFELIDYPIFNLADSCVCVGTFLLAFYILFVEGKEPRKAGEGEETHPRDGSGEASPETDEIAADGETAKDAKDDDTTRAAETAGPSADPDRTGETAKDSETTGTAGPDAPADTSQPS